MELVGQIKPGLPSFALPDVALGLQIWPAALGIALMSFVETIAVGRAFVRPGEPVPTPNRELMAIALTNLAGSAFQNMPSGGGMSQTAVFSDAARADGRARDGGGRPPPCTPRVAHRADAPRLAAVVVATTVGPSSPPSCGSGRFGGGVRVGRGRDDWRRVLGTLNGIPAAILLSVLVLFYEANRPPVYVLGRQRGTDVFVPLT